MVRTIVFWGVYWGPPYFGKLPTKNLQEPWPVALPRERLRIPWKAMGEQKLDIVKRFPEDSTLCAFMSILTSSSSYVLVIRTAWKESVGANRESRGMWFT